MRRLMDIPTLLGTAAALFTLAALNVSTAAADEAFYRIPLPELEQQERDYRSGADFRTFAPYARVMNDTQAEAYFSSNVYADASNRWRNANGQQFLFVRTTGQNKPRGFVARPGRKALIRQTFMATGQQASADWKDEFYAAKNRHYEFLRGQNLVGGAWFRHQAAVARNELGVQARELTQRELWQSWSPRRREDLFDYFAGSRAISENLQLDRHMPPGEKQELSVDLDSVEGITIEEFDWKSRLEGKQPTLDPLAKTIPADQYALFFNSPQAVRPFLLLAANYGLPVLRGVDSDGGAAQAALLYQNQMCLPVFEGVEKLADGGVESIAVTGGDPYFLLGTDLAVLLETEAPDKVVGWMRERMAEAGRQYDSAQRLEGKVGDVAYEAIRTPGRELSCYVAAWSDTVAITNSKTQLERLAAARTKKSANMASLDEYRFFRSRYEPTSAPSALVVITDPAIRKWSSPKWRIGNSRRLRAAAILAETQAAHLQQVVAADIDKTVESSYSVPNLGQLRVTADGVRSEAYGTPEFMTPIAEMQFVKITRDESDLYQRWRQGYERNWSNYFDPIALQIVFTPTAIETDLTVMPLIDNSDYRQLLNVAEGAELSPAQAALPKGSIAHVAFAINPRRAINSAGGLRGVADSIPTAWIGDSVSVSLAASPFWKELTESNYDPNWALMNIHRTPVAVEVEVNSGAALAAFLTGIRTYVAEAVPGMVQWETKKHRDEPYVRVSLTERGRSFGPWDEASICYYATGKRFLISFNEELVQNGIERALGQQRNDAPEPLGKHAVAQVSKEAAAAVEGLYGREMKQAMRAHAFSRIAILNEWKRLYPDRDPVALHEEYWGGQVESPATGEYVWNEKWQTMESTVYGHPGEPKSGPRVLESLGFESASAGLTGEEDGLRARLRLTLPQNR